MTEFGHHDRESEVPNGLAHIDMIARFNHANRGISQSLLETHRPELKLLGSSLHVLYLAATCHRKCWGGGHVMEFMAGRVYNLTCAAYSLICIAYYDESLSLIRSIGESANLLSLFHMDETAFPKWVKADRAERLREFGPAKVRRRLAGGQGVLLMDDARYAELCEAYTHPTPGTAPNQHNDMRQAICGGIVQPEGLDRALGELVSMAGAISLYYAKLFGFEDLFDGLEQQFAEDRCDDNGHH